MQHPIVIIGAGLAGYQLAREFRKLDQTTPLTLITADDGRFYSKPMLSNALTIGKTSDAIAIANAEMMATQLNAHILTHKKVSGFDTTEKMIFFDNAKIPYEKLVLACGADVIKPPLKGSAVENVLSINHIYHYTEFRELIKNKKRIGILGAGLIGSEFANDLSNAGYEVHVIAPAKTPLDLLVPEKVGKILQEALEKNGVHFHLECVANQIDKYENGNYCLELSNGNFIEVEFVLSAIGLRPHIDLAQRSELKTNRLVHIHQQRWFLNSDSQ